MATYKKPQFVKFFYCFDNKMDKKYKRNFICLFILFLIVEITCLVLETIYLQNENNYKTQALTFIFNNNAMILIGFSFAFASISYFQWSTFAFSYLIYALTFQNYIVLSSVWEMAFSGSWGVKNQAGDDRAIKIDQEKLIRAGYCSFTMLISSGALLGRVGGVQLLFTCIFGTIGYTLNERILLNNELYDSAGSMIVNCFGAYFGLTIGLIIFFKQNFQQKLQKDYIKIFFTTAGTFILWMYWPLFNSSFAFYTSRPEEQRILISAQIQTTTLFALLGSTISSLLINIVLSKHLKIRNFMLGSLSGGIIVGSSSIFLEGKQGSAGFSLIVGFIGGIITTIYSLKAKKSCEKSCSFYDQRCINGLHGIPAILGTFISLIAIAIFYDGKRIEERYIHQIQALFISLGLAIGFGIIVGFLLVIMNNCECIKLLEDKDHGKNVYVKIRFAQKKGQLDSLMEEVKKQANPRQENQNQ